MKSDFLLLGLMLRGSPLRFDHLSMREHTKLPHPEVLALASLEGQP